MTKRREENATDVGFVVGLVLWILFAIRCFRIFPARLALPVSMSGSYLFIGLVWATLRLAGKRWGQDDDLVA